MKLFFTGFLFVLFIFAADAQPKKQGRVKRKYRNPEQVSEQQPAVVFRGRVRDVDRNTIAGANVEIEGLNRRVHTNADGEFLLTNLPSDRLRIKISKLGFRTKTIDYTLQTGQNSHYIALDKEFVHLEPVTVTAQKREQQPLDIPGSINTVTSPFMEKLHLYDKPGIAEIIPGLHLQELGNTRTDIAIRGRPGIAVYSDQIPVTRHTENIPELFDMERVEIIKGPQNTLFGKDAHMGALHLLSKQPENTTEGYLTVGAGSFMGKEFRGAVNVPLIEDRLFVRAAGIYNNTGGYVENTLGENLNGNNTMGGRFSVRILPAFRHKIDLVFNYQKNDEPGVAFMSKQEPGEQGETDLFDYRASLNEEEKTGTGNERFNASLTYRLFQNEHTYWTLISSWQQNKSFARRDEDGTALPAINTQEEGNAEQFYQELRYNFSRKSRSNGSAGVSYRNQNSTQLKHYAVNGQHLLNLLSNPPDFIMPGYNQLTVLPQPLNPQPVEDITLPDTQSEEKTDATSNQSIEAYIHFTYQFYSRLFFTGGARAVYDQLLLRHKARLPDQPGSGSGEQGTHSTNLFFQPAENQSIGKRSLSFTWRGGLTFRYNENASFFANYSRGRDPHTLQFLTNGTPEILDPETVTSYDAGMKLRVLKRIYIEGTGFYQTHKNVKMNKWNGDPSSERFGFLKEGGGKATSWGAEAGLNVAVLKGLDLFGNYGWFYSAFDSTDVNGLDQEYAGNRFSLAPEHRFSVGINARTNVTKGLQVFINPWYTWKTHFWFDDANSPWLVQPSYGLLNVNAGIEMENAGLTLSVNGTNLLEEQYLISAGNTGNLFGNPTFVPAPPRMLGARLTWKF